MNMIDIIMKTYCTYIGLFNPVSIGELLILL